MCATDRGDLKTAITALLIAQDYMQYQKEGLGICSLSEFYKKMYEGYKWAVCGAVSNMHDLVEDLELGNAQKEYLAKILDQEIYMSRTGGALTRVPAATASWA